MITNIISLFNYKLHYVNYTVNVFLLLLSFSSFVPANLFTYSSTAVPVLMQDSLCSDDGLPL